MVRGSPTVKIDFVVQEYAHHSMNDALRRLRCNVGTFDHDLKAETKQLHFFLLEVQLLGKSEPHPVREANCQFYERKYSHITICSE